ncbi:hypothetical protein EJB05_25445, partial [Eragrostis curvula]
GGTPDDATSSSGDKYREEAAPLPPRQDARALRRMLLGLTRGYYLDAISRLPTADLRTALARGLLVGGHCYGPLHPVHNIIANSVWYAAAFPLGRADRIDQVGVLSAKGTDRAVRRSLDGSVAFLHHLCPSLSLDDALWHLCLARADLRDAVASARGASVRPSFLCAKEPEEGQVKAAFLLAAQTARHRQPSALAFFASSVLPDVEHDVVRLLVTGKHGLSSLDIESLSRLLLPHPLSSSQPPPQPSPKINQVIADRRRGMTIWYDGLLRLAEAALSKFAHQTGVQYQLHVIYGESLLEDDDNYDQYFHINFMAQPKEEPGAGPGHRLFFFAEAPRPRDLDFHEEDVSLCCLVQPSPADIDNCLACLTDKVKIDHPAVHSPVLLFGEQCYEIDKVDHEWDFRPVLGIDYLFFDSVRDNELVEYLHNHFARIDAYCSNLTDGPPAVNYCRRLG